MHRSTCRATGEPTIPSGSRSILPRRRIDFGQSISAITACWATTRRPTSRTIAPPTSFWGNRHSPSARPMRESTAHFSTPPTPSRAAARSSFRFGVAVDDAGGVYVADTSNSRILHFLDPFSSGDATRTAYSGRTNFINRIPDFPYGTASSLAGTAACRSGPATTSGSPTTLDHRVIRFADAPTQPAPVAPPTWCSDRRLRLHADLSALRAGLQPQPHELAEACYAAGHRARLRRRFRQPPRARLRPPFSNGMNASAVFGQANLTPVRRQSRRGAGRRDAEQPVGRVGMTVRARLHRRPFNNRVLMYNAPFAGGN